MRFAHHTIVRLAAALALTAASASAFAQSAEYRRGYEDGYAAGQRAALDERGYRGGYGDDRGYRDERGRGPGWGRLSVEQAEYGARGRTCDARWAVRQEAERNGGAVLAGNQLCGDPAFKVPKTLTVVYRCGNDAPLQASARENDTLRLVCRR